MMDHMEKFVFMQRSSFMEESIESKKFCIECNTSKTPLWRGGPAGPKSLCNACGIKYRKKRRALLNLNGGGSESKKQKLRITITSTAITTTVTSTAANAAADYGSTSSDTGDENGLKALRLKGSFADNEIPLSSSSSLVVKKPKQKRKKGITEEEEAAYTLMAMSRALV